MSGTSTDQPRIRSATPGRIRVHLPAWSGRGPRELERHLRHLPGVRRAEANPLTRSVLVLFDPRESSQQAVLAALDDARNEAEQGPEEEPPLPHVIEDNHAGKIRRARIAVRGLDRHPD